MEKVLKPKKEHSGFGVCFQMFDASAKKLWLESAFHMMTGYLMGFWMESPGRALPIVQ